MLSRFSSLRREVVSPRFLAEKLIYVRDASWPYNLVSECGISTARPESAPGKAFADFAIFKGKAALLMTPVPPTFTKMESGCQRIDRKGVVLFKFMPAIGPRKYDAERKQFFALSATEIGSLISLGPAESCEFFHDPSMKSSLEGQVKKTLSIAPFNDGGYMFNLSVLNSILKTNEHVILPVTKAEFSVMRSVCGFALPHILGWDRIVGPRGHTGDGQVKQHGMKMDPDWEWER